MDQKEVSWTKAYQNDPADRTYNQQQKKKELMLRPRFPPVYHEHEMPRNVNHHELSAFIFGDWKIGDFVDWWSDSCFWSCRIVAILGNNCVQVDLPKPPMGEGHSYKVNCKDLRPSLLWSIESGWSVPFCKLNAGGLKSCVRLCIPSRSIFDHCLHMNSHDLERITSEEYHAKYEWEASAQMRQHQQNHATQSSSTFFTSCSTSKWCHQYSGASSSILLKSEKGYETSHECVTEALHENGHSVGELNASVSSHFVHNHCIDEACFVNKKTQQTKKGNLARAIVKRAILFHHKSKLGAHKHPSEESNYRWHGIKRKYSDYCKTLEASSVPNGSINTGRVCSSKRERFNETTLASSDNFFHTDNHGLVSKDVLSASLKTLASARQRKMKDSSEDAVAKKKIRRKRSTNVAKEYKAQATSAAYKNTIRSQHQRVITRFSNLLKNCQGKQLKGDTASQPVPSNQMGSSQNYRGRLTMDATRLESSVFALEELLDKVKWLKGVLQFGSKEWSMMAGATWQFSGKMGSSQAS